MVTYKVLRYVNGKMDIEGDCLSGDQKPTGNILNGSKMFEMDTSTMYKFSEENAEWLPWGGDDDAV